MTLLLRSSLMIFVVCLLLVNSVIFMPYDNSPVEAFMRAPENCYGDCLMGIRPNVTTVREAMLILREHVWATEISQVAPGTGYGQITWEWSGQEHTLIDTRREGRLTFYWENDAIRSQALGDVLIETVTIYTEMRIYPLQRYFGNTDKGSASLRPGGNLAYSLVYNNPYELMNFAVELPCPIHMTQVWSANTRLTLSIGRVNGSFINPLDLPDLCDDGMIEASHATIFGKN